MAVSRNLINVLGLLVTLTVINHSINVAGQGLPTSGMFLFGDSYFDVGNKKYLTTKFLPSTTWPYGKSTDYPNGRYSDGRIVPDYLATFCGIPNPIPPALNPTANISRGVGFAVADASVLGNPPETLTLPEQVAKFGQMRTNWTDEFLSESLFLIQIGTEDYLAFINKNPDADGSAQEAFVKTVVNQIKIDLTSLYNMGGRKFAYQTLPPIGCFPIVRQNRQLVGDNCYEKLNDIALLHNLKIRPMLADLAKQFPAFQYNVLDFYGALERRLPSDTSINYRFSNTVDACCGIGSHNAFGCGYANVHSNLCSYQRAYLYFDGRHNTEKANEEMAHLWFGADTNVVGPMNLRELLTYPPNMSMLEY